ncbi:unnamed protein product [Soboliphyme baturini]|uniref:Apyrase n=1 Tax=Soboliphyme baturini TaxID=241478 RepID=A0A183IE92_9BILA|nr:unnamed protein product [Soboliphyme baturini]
MKLTLASFVVLFLSFLLMLWRVPVERRRCVCDDDMNYFESYNDTYPLSAPFSSKDGIWYKIGAVSDLDTNSKSKSGKHLWRSYMLHGKLFVSNDHKEVKIVWDKNVIQLNGGYAHGGRAMELSDLKTFNGRLYSIDDRTGILYRIENDSVVLPWVVLPDGDGKQAKGFKGEWLAVKDNHIYVGGLGKEWTTTTGEYMNDDPMWVKIISHYGFVRHVNWKRQYIKLRKAFGITYPGYMIHESAQWSNVHKRWFFLPRRASHKIYTEKTDERSGMISPVILI